MTSRRRKPSKAGHGKSLRGERARRIQHNRTKRQQNQKSKKHQRRRHLGKFQTFRVTVPAIFDLSPHYESTIKLFENLRKSVLIEKKRCVLIDFNECSVIAADAGLILAAEVDRCRTLRRVEGKPTLTGNYPHDEDVKHFLQEMGFFRHLNIVEPPERTDSEMEKGFLTIESGIRDRGDKVNTLTNLVFTDAIQLAPKAKSKLYRALTEAMNNVTKHAYMGKLAFEYPIFKGKWWMAGYRDYDNKQVMFFMYDQGIGIPATFPGTNKSHFERLARRFSGNLSDDKIIAEAMRLGATRTRRQGRGKGMADLQQFVRMARDGHLRILSGRGLYVYSSSDVEKTSRLPEAMVGTFIEWRIRDEDVIEWKDDHDSA